MDMLRSFCKRITDDLKQKELIPLKILFFVQASTVLVLYPYLTIHMRELGINVEETAIMSAVTPAVSIVMPPLAGMLADKIGNFKLLLAVASLLGGASALLLLLVPVGRITVTFPTAVELLASCGNDGLRLQNLQEYPCLPIHPYAHDINMTLLSCGFLCQTPLNMTTEDMDNIIHSRAYDVQIQSQSDSQKMLFRHSVTSQFPRSNAPLKDQSTSHVITNDPFFNISISKVSKDGFNMLYFPTPQLYNFECSQSLNTTCLFGSNDIFSEAAPLAKQIYKARITHDEQTVPTHVKDYWVKAIAIGNMTKLNEDDGSADGITCQDKFDTPGQQVVRVMSGSARLSRCSAACALAAPRRDLCDNKQQLIDIDPVFTFWTYLAVRVFVGIIGSTAFAMFEGAVIAILREHKADYGMQRLYGSIGGMISSPLSGMLIDYASRGKGYTDFRPAFYLYAILKILCAVLMMFIDLKFKQPAKNLMKDVVHVFKNVEIVGLFLATFVLGTAWGYIESFLFWLLQDLGGSRSLMGITVTVGGIAGIPLLVLSGPIIRRLGHANVLFIGFVFYAIRLYGYSLIYNPWLCLIFEAMESVTSSLTFTAAITYAARLSSTTTDTSVQGLLGGIYYGVGKGAGSLIGGYLMKFFGTRPTYQIFASSMLIFGVIYYLINLLYLRKRSANDDNDIDKKPASDIENQDSKKDIKLTKTDITDEKDKVQDARRTNGDADGGSDSGVENPAFETEGAANGTKELKKE